MNARDASRWLEAKVERGLDGTWHTLRRRPYLAVGVATAAGLTAAAAVGAAELAFGIGVGYGAYLILKKNEAPSQAVKSVRALEGALGA